MGKKYAEQEEVIFHSHMSIKSIRIETLEDAEIALEKAKLCYLEFIRKSAADAGSMRQLSAKLGRAEQSVQVIIERNSLSALRRLANEIKGLK